MLTLCYYWIHQNFGTSNDFSLIAFFILLPCARLLLSERSFGTCRPLSAAVIKGHCCSMCTAAFACFNGVGQSHELGSPLSY